MSSANNTRTSPADDLAKMKACYSVTELATASDLDRLDDPHTAGEVPAAEDTDLDDPDIYPMAPSIDSTAREFNERFVDYDLRRPGDVVLSGPVIGGWGPGRFYRSRRTAHIALSAKYGSERVEPVVGRTRGRWAFLVKNLRNTGGTHEALAA